MPHHSGEAGWVMHLFRRSEIVDLVRSARFAITEILPVGTNSDGQLSHAWFLPALRANGFLIAAHKPVESVRLCRPRGAG